MDRSLAGFFWIALYLIVVLVPVGLMLVPPLPSGRAFWVELSVVLGFMGLTQIGIQFVLIARFKQVTAPYGIDIVLRYHREVALVAVAFVLLHPLLILIEHPSRIMLFNPFGGTWASRFGLIALALLIAIVVTSIWRERLRINYERWRIAHALMGIGVLVFAQAHVSMAGLYVNTTWKHVLWIASSAILVSLVAYLRLVKPAMQRQRPWRVAEVNDEGGDTYALTIEPDGHDGMRFLPGQFAWIKVGQAYSADEHPFSFASSSEKPERVRFGIKALGDFSSSVPEFEPGTPVYVDGPHGAFSIDRDEAAGFVFLAGGIGVTPFVSMLHTMADREDPRPVWLIYADKTEDDLAFRQELEELCERVDLEIRYVLEEAPDDWEGETGFLDADMLQRIVPDKAYRRHYFICGPPPMMEAVHEALRELDVAEERIHQEKFQLA